MFLSLQAVFMLGFIPPVKKQGIFTEIMTEIIIKETIPLIVSIQILLSLTMQSSMHIHFYIQFIHISFPAMTC